MNGEVAVTATFTARRTLTMTTTGPGSGHVTGPGISCRDCSAAYDDGTHLTLTPVHGQHSRFAGWTGACSGFHLCSVTGDGKIDDPGAAIWTPPGRRSRTRHAPALGSQLDELDSLFSRFDAPPGGQYDGWHQYFDRDIRKLLGIRQPQPFANSYCGRGKLYVCRGQIWAAIAAAGRELTKVHGISDPSAWRADVNAEWIHFVPRHPVADDALHEPPERDPAGELVQGSPLRGARSAGRRPISRLARPGALPPLGLGANG